MALVGASFRGQLSAWIDDRPPELQCLEVTADYYYELDTLERLRSLAAVCPLSIRTASLSLGTAGPLDPFLLDNLARVVAETDPLWVSEHVGFLRVEGVDLRSTSSVQPTHENAQILADHARQLAAHCGKPVILENITSEISIPGPLSEPEFLNLISAEADCGLLLNLTGLFVNSRNHGFDPLAFLREIDCGRIAQLRITPCAKAGGRWRYLRGGSIPDDVWQLVEAALVDAPVQALILERQEGFPRPSVLAAELSRLAAAVSKTVIGQDASESVSP